MGSVTTIAKLGMVEFVYNYFDVATQLQHGMTVEDKLNLSVRPWLSHLKIVTENLLVKLQKQVRIQPKRVNVKTSGPVVHHAAWLTSRGNQFWHVVTPIVSP